MTDDLWLARYYERTKRLQHLLDSHAPSFMVTTECALVITAAFKAFEKLPEMTMLGSPNVEWIEVIKRLSENQ